MRAVRYSPCGESEPTVVRLIEAVAALALTATLAVPLIVMVLSHG